MLLQHAYGPGVNVALGVVDEFAEQNTRFDAASQAALESPHGQIDRWTALALVTTNLEKALGVGARSRGPRRNGG